MPLITTGLSGKASLHSDLTYIVVWWSRCCWLMMEVLTLHQQPLTPPLQEVVFLIVGWAEYPGSSEAFHGYCGSLWQAGLDQP